jgi:sn-glycerol 3-phosphate transport system substrate-binding protein
MQTFLLKRLGALASLGLLAGAASAAQPVEVHLWHSMSGPAGQEINVLAERFNASQRDVRVLPDYKGPYDETLAAALEAGKAGNAPELVQIYEVATASMMANHKIIRPLYQVLSESGVKLDPQSFFPALQAYYGERQGRLEALPFNVSTPVLLYNRDAFKQAGLDPMSPPRTWRDIQAMTVALQTKGATPCGYTTDWQSWIHLENLSAWHNEPFATHGNGIEAPDAELNFNSTFMLRHVSLLSAWARSGLFTYAGRRDEGSVKFQNGECAILTTSSASLAAILEQAKFSVGVAPLPYYDEYAGGPYATMLGGAALWVMQGKKPAQYKASARFLAYLAKPEAQAEWHQSTGYLPVSRAAYELTRKSGFYEKTPGYVVAIQEISGRVGPNAGRGVRLRNFERIRAVLDEQLERVWRQEVAPKDALDQAVAQGNALLQVAAPER